MRFILHGDVVPTWLIGLGVLLAWPDALSASVGAGLIALGFLLRVWTKGCLQPEDQLTFCGPFRWTRNPLYLANLIICLGLCFIINSPHLTVTFAVAWTVLFHRRIFDEERARRTLHDHAWTTYEHGVPALLPHRRPFRDVPPNQAFSWSSPNLVNDEMPRLTRLAGYPLILWIAGHIGPMMWYHQHTANLQWLAGPEGTTCLAGVAALYAVAAILNRQLRFRQPVLPALLHSPNIQIALVLAYLATLAIVRLGALTPSRYTLAGGIVLLVLGFRTFQNRPTRPSLPCDAAAWSFALAGAGLLAGLPWIMILAVTAAVLLCIDSHISPDCQTGTVNSLIGNLDHKKPLWNRLGFSAYYMLFALAVLAIALGRIG